MTRSGSLVLSITLGTGLLACSSGDGGGSSKGPLDLVPASNAVSGWTVDKDHSKNADGSPMTATDATGVIGLIDGGGESYFKGYTPKLFVWQPYVNESLPSVPDGASLDLRVIEYPSADQASGIYSAVLNLGDYAARTPEGWQPTSPAIGTEARIQDTTRQWWVNFHQGVFYVEVVVDPSTGPEPNFTPGNEETKKEAIRFAQAVAGKI